MNFASGSRRQGAANDMDISETTARLRRTFHYPTDDSSNGGTPEVLDEEGMFAVANQIQLNPTA